MMNMKGMSGGPLLLLLLQLSSFLNVASSLDLDLQLFTKQEIMANLTTESALKIVMGLERLHSRPKLAGLLEAKFGHLVHGGFKSNLRAVQRHDADKLDKDDELSRAKDMLNGMMAEAQINLDIEQKKTSDYKRTQTELVEATRQDIASFNSMAADSRGHVLKAQAGIGGINYKLPKVEDEMGETKEQCTADVTALKSELANVLKDLRTMMMILNMTQCAPKGFFLQSSTAHWATEESAIGGLISCSYCAGGAGVVMLQQDRLQSLLSHLVSTVAKHEVQFYLADLFEDVTAEKPLMNLTHAQVARQLALLRRQDPAAVAEAEMLKAEADAKELAAGSKLKVAENAAKVSDKPAKAEAGDCVPTVKCTLGDSNCQELTDRFMQIQAGIMDKKTELTEALVNKETFCEETVQTLDAQVGSLSESLREQQTNLATSTKDQVESESQSGLKSKQFEEQQKEYTAEMAEHCSTQNEFRTELCALEKIRGELYKMAGKEALFADCEVTDWSPQECSATCGGGIQLMKRSRLQSPNGGMECPPMQMEQECNTFKCPVDCVLEEWSGFSACSAECGGGVKERARNVKVEMENAGEPCEATEESVGCNLQSCDADCTLSDWTAWTSCSKICNGGSQRQEKTILEPARGTGKCFEPYSAERWELKDCNMDSCQSMLTGTNRTTLKCVSKVDIIVMLDGSGSLGEDGWAKSKSLSEKLIDAMVGGDDKVKVAFQLFSGPKTWGAYEKCTGVAEGAGAPDLAKDCEIRWVSHFTNDTASVAAWVKEMQYPAATTLTSVALAEAQGELMNGREDANSVVIIITDGSPMSAIRTKQAATRLKEKARVIWVPVGRSAPFELISELASKPESDHVVKVLDIKMMDSPKVVNTIIADTCPKVE
mmetsp:Transcript_65519/g.213335  ORF Transcript_65519/g.213335 Transcript_65519/m.213335 type:complete len:887 (-) Transcript_65519:188-2848(-)|eukprot:CAMPEP_0204124376 /NCGR_PEP_ID=MMETSP0361-20130328/9806_1 /ASSEMBLY_ACC=CAM_ASM_000343 /TAXON_ID=268821 /ORGANISM="Scrippsiella Hangoei, Strain SHTV-5" /LENGTH=886 /DNA_ID=CAMNT_0051075921 /DNA_START=1545 /DNA_END=4205 /DNA_ORIENTATION=-